MYTIKTNKLENKNKPLDTNGERTTIIINSVNRRRYKVSSRVLLKYACPGIFLFSPEARFFSKTRLKRSRKITELINLNGSEENEIRFLSVALRSTPVSDVSTFSI